MTPSNILNLALLFVAMLTAVFTFLQAREARIARGASEKARDEADEFLAAAKRAATAAEASAGSSERSAAALERQADLAEKASKPADPWEIEKVGQHRWAATNKTGHKAMFVNIETSPPGHIQSERGSYADVAQNQSLFFIFGGGLTDPSSVDVEISWRSPVTRASESQHFTVSQD
ncbi:hypothetical protein [Agreia sp. Leaf283]|uniref:hypothetical protein n=1 Tax=Agreia sp. Leaf283 TaxID=1736321 RepID=UPI0007018298|nr:hypothetical protein [Agreia sp. Leaf283]KQP57794.1 hypothetical protein ASF51_08375 [Agreia sp. Leaf283]